MPDALAITPLSNLASTSDTTSYQFNSGLVLPADRAFIALVFATGTAAAGSFTGGGLTWTRADTQVYNTTDKAYLFWAVNLTGADITTSTAAGNRLTFNCTGDASTGIVAEVYSVKGANLTTPIGQIGKGADVTANPVATFGSALNTNNAYIVGFGINRAAPASTSPASWSEDYDTGGPNPNQGAAGGYRINGETGTTITFTAAAGNWGAIGCELTAMTTTARRFTAAGAMVEMKPDIIRRITALGAMVETFGTDRQIAALDVMIDTYNTGGDRDIAFLGVMIDGFPVTDRQIAWVGLMVDSTIPAAPPSGLNQVIIIG